MCTGIRPRLRVRLEDGLALRPRFMPRLRHGLDMPAQEVALAMQRIQGVGIGARTGQRIQGVGIGARTGLAAHPCDAEDAPVIC